MHCHERLQSHIQHIIIWGRTGIKQPNDPPRTKTTPPWCKHFDNTAISTKKNIQTKHHALPLHRPRQSSLNHILQLGALPEPAGIHRMGRRPRLPRRIRPRQCSRGLRDSRSDRRRVGGGAVLGGVEACVGEECHGRMGSAGALEEVSLHLRCNGNDNDNGSVSRSQLFGKLILLSCCFFAQARNATEVSRCRGDYGRGSSRRRNWTR